jgi:organic radical activating enzyme
MLVRRVSDAIDYEDIMKANNITICVPSDGCTRDCPYCVSKMTPDSIGVYKFNEERVRLALNFATTLGATSLLITSRGEPMLNIEDVRMVLRAAKEKYLPTEIQTNGDVDEYVEELAQGGLSVYAVSIDNAGQVKSQQQLYRRIIDNSMILRWTVVLHEETMKMGVAEWLALAESHGVRQLTFRKLTVPNNPRDPAPAEWIANNTHPLDAWMGALDRYVEKRKVIRTLAFGPKVIEAGSISLTYFPYCIQESGNEEELRSLILRDDGHVYTDWNSMASVLF